MRFTPTRPDGRSYRDVALDVLTKMEPQQVISYQQLGEHLDLDPVRQRTRIQQSVRQANKILLKLHSRGVEVISNVGYRMIEAREHMVVAVRHQGKAERAMVRAIEFFDGANLSEMTEVERRLHQGQAMLAQAVYASHKSLDKRIKRIESILDPKSQTITIDHE